MNSRNIQKIKSMLTWAVVFLLLAGGVQALVSCKVFRALKKDKDNNNIQKEQPALYGPPPSGYKK